MIYQETLDFLRELHANNHRGWFEKNRQRYLLAKQNIEEVTACLIREIACFHPTIAPVQAKDCVFRIYRDIRFTKDKTPYKTNLGAFISEDGKNSIRAGYYLHVQPDNASFLAGGIYMPQPWLLKAIRQEIDYNTEEFKRILNKKSFRKYFGTLWGNKLKNAPKGYDKNHPDIHLLQYTSYIVMHPLNDSTLLQQHFTKTAATVFREMYPFNQFLNRAIP